MTNTTVARERGPAGPYYACQPAGVISLDSSGDSGTNCRIPVRGGAVGNLWQKSPAKTRAERYSFAVDIAFHTASGLVDELRSAN
jgi:hypothetical protein